MKLKIKATPQYRSSTIFFARSNVCPKNWSYDHVGFITTDGQLIQMSGHKYGEGVYLQKAITDDPAFPSQKLYEVPIGKQITLDLDSEGLQNCGMYVVAQLHKNGIKKSTEDLYRIMRKPRA